MNNNVPHQQNENYIPGVSADRQYLLEIANEFNDALEVGVRSGDVEDFIWTTIESMLKRSCTSFNNYAYARAVVPVLLLDNPDYAETIILLTGSLATTRESDEHAEKLLSRKDEDIKVQQANRR